MNEQEMLETTRIRSLMHKEQIIHALIHERPFCEIHPTISEAGLIGGSMNALPGQITAAHNGVLFMDEFSEFSSAALEALRQPLEERRITVARSKAVIEYPAAFMLVAAMNPCACGYYGHPTIKCRCSKRALWWHHRKLSGPIIDRFDLCVEADAMDAEEIFAAPTNEESSFLIQQRVIKARSIQSKRLARITPLQNNAQLSHDLVQQYCVLDEYAKRFLQRQFNISGLSMRALDKSLKVARTIADLSGSKIIELQHIAEALSFRFALPLHEMSSAKSSTKKILLIINFLIMRTTSFKYGKSYRIPYRGCYCHSFAELKYAMSIENDYRYLREPAIIGYDPKTYLTTNYFREETKLYTPDFLVRSKITGEVTLVEIKPAEFRNDPMVKVYASIANHYIEQNKLPWQFRMIFEDEMILPEEQQQKFNLFWKKRKSFESVFQLHRLDRQYNATSIKYFSSVPLFPEEKLTRNEYARFVRLGT